MQQVKDSNWPYIRGDVYPYTIQYRLPDGTITYKKEMVIHNPYSGIVESINWSVGEMKPRVLYGH